MTDIVKVKQDGVQVYVQTHWTAILDKPDSYNCCSNYQC